MKIFTKVPVKRELENYFVEFENGKKLPLSRIIQQYMNEEEPKEWITVRGNHIPIMEGESKDEAVHKFLKKKGLDKTDKSDYNISRGGTHFSEYAASRDDKSVTPEKILKQIGSFVSHSGKRYSGADIQKIASQLDAKNKEIRDKKQQTHDKYRKSGERETAIYEPDRVIEHNKLLSHFFKDIKNKRPAKGEKPTFIMLGGRGGSGKSKFAGEVYDKDKFVVLDADEIKKLLPEYKGWNAAEVHQESSDILDKALRRAKNLGLNVVLDATMKGLETSKRRLQQFKDAGYRTEAHYMYLPRQKSAERAVKRYFGEEGGRYVPLEVLLDMKTNESTFDELKEMVDGWSFSDNDVDFNEAPKLVEKGGEFYYKKGGPVWKRKK